MKIGAMVIFLVIVNAVLIMYLWHLYEIRKLEEHYTSMLERRDERIRKLSEEVSMRRAAERREMLMKKVKEPLK